MTIISRLIIGMLLVVGIGYSIYDFKQWRYEETHAFGQGPSDNLKFEILNFKWMMYQDNLLGIRFKYPENVKIGEQIKFKVENTNENLIDIVDREAKKIAEMAERKYVNTERASITVLTWSGGQRAMIRNGTDLITIESTLDEKIFWEVLKSVTFF